MKTIEIIALGKLQHSCQVQDHEVFVKIQKPIRKRGRPPKLQSSRTVTDSSQQVKVSKVYKDEQDEELSDAQMMSDSDQSQSPNETESDEEQFLKKLENKNKEPEVDFDKMTRRQRMAYQAQNATESQDVEIQ